MTTIELPLYFKQASDRDAALALLVAGLPEDLRPRYYSQGESLRNKKHLVEDEAGFTQFRKRNPQGYFLFSEGKRLVFDVGTGPRGFTGITVDGSVELIDVPEYFHTVSSVQPTFGYAATYEERWSWNGIDLRIGKSRIEQWVGRDLTRYLPGLYWTTYISDAIAAQHGVDLEVLKAAAVRVERDRAGHGTLFRFYDDPADWPQHAPRLEEVAQRAGGIFTPAEARKAVADIKTFADLETLFALYR